MAEASLPSAYAVRRGAPRAAASVARKASAAIAAADAAEEEDEEPDSGEDSFSEEAPASAKTSKKARKAPAEEEEEEEEDGAAVRADAASDSEASGEEGESARCCQSTAMSSRYCLSKKDLETLDFVNRPNPHHRSGPPMKLYDREEVKALALSKYGNNAGIRAEAAKREVKSAKAAATRIFNDGWRNLPTRWSPALHRTFSDPFKQTVRAFLLSLARKVQTNEYVVIGELVIKAMVEHVPTLPKHAKPKQQRGGARRGYYQAHYYDEMLGGDDW